MKNDEKCFDLLYRNYFSDIVGFIFKKIRNSQTAEEIAQEIFANIYAKKKNLSPESSISKRYLFVCAKNKMIDLGKSRDIIILTIIGAIAGVYTATIVSNEQFLSVFKYLMIIMLLIILVKPERWLIPSGIKNNLSYWISIPSFLALGFYGGFIQMGMGVFFLAVLVLISKYSIMEANAIKTIVIFTLILPL